ncbi:acetyl-CoA carboxylase carboxyltransferase subunit alpha [Candidatus Stoquefichus massiliensis]|uniref:acetyl-CoA carboxylase carboxyltransferase subunit alpha n=1 Tax=Candidatus Stoquefichus massiliensis TaxID=1470350 RepID=UPI00048A2814|nr:acetyl-CoA carboxylase carboxyltransferase subunit alpha [Candidatus Stoquefichus massiliensis]
MSLIDNERKIKELQATRALLDAGNEYDQLSKEIDELMKETYDHLTPWDRVCLARHPNRPKAIDFIDGLFEHFYELHGDRCYGDDHAIIGGVGYFHDMPVTVIAQAKGKTLQENLDRHFGMCNPEGYRKALRLARQAEKFHRPIITFVDTAGAYPGIEAEERGQAQAIADCLYTFSDIKTPVICVVLSEGGSGGALALSVADRICMLENAVYSVLSPEGFASILWKDDSRVQEAADVMKLTSYDLYDKGIVDYLIKEPTGGMQNDLKLVLHDLDRYLYETLQTLKATKEKDMLDNRYGKFRKMGSMSR